MGTDLRWDTELSAGNQLKMVTSILCTLSDRALLTCMGPRGGWKRLGWTFLVLEALRKPAVGNQEAGPFIA